MPLCNRISTDLKDLSQRNQKFLWISVPAYWIINPKGRKWLLIVCLFLSYNQGAPLSRERLNSFTWKGVIVLLASLMVQMVNNMSATWETWVPSLGREDPLEKGMMTHCSILAWRIPWPEKPGPWRTTIHKLQRIGHSWVSNILMRQ